MEYHYIRRKQYYQILHYGQISAVIKFFAVVLSIATVSFLVSKKYPIDDVTYNRRNVSWGSGDGQEQIAGSSWSLSLRSPVLVFSTIPKTGFETLETAMKLTLEENGVDAIKDANVEKNTQKSFVSEVSSLTRRTVIFASKLHFVDFTSEERTPPVWVSFIADPISKLKGHFLEAKSKEQRPEERAGDVRPNFEEAAWKDLDTCIQTRDPKCLPQAGANLSTPISFFCGYEEECRQFKSIWASHQARNHVELWYPIVGVYEELEDTVQVLEGMMPEYFEGLGKKWRSLKGGDGLSKVESGSLSEESIRILKEALHMEFTLYDYLRERLKKQAKQFERPEEHEEEEEKEDEGGPDA